VCGCVYTCDTGTNTHKHTHAKETQTSGATGERLPVVLVCAPAAALPHMPVETLLHAAGSAFRRTLSIVDADVDLRQLAADLHTKFRWFLDENVSVHHFGFGHLFVQHKMEFENNGKTGLFLWFCVLIISVDHLLASMSIDFPLVMPETLVVACFALITLRTTVHSPTIPFVLSLAVSPLDTLSRFFSSIHPLCLTLLTPV